MKIGGLCMDKNNVNHGDMGKKRIGLNENWKFHI